MADELELSVSMLMQVKSGERQLSPRALFRLECAEKTAGLRYPEAASLDTHGSQMNDARTTAIDEALAALERIKDQVRTVETKLLEMRK